MFPPTHNLDIDARAISGITGSISIACWVIVFSPQIIVNFRRGSAEGLSLTFLAVWLLGDVFNVLGAVLQGVLPTMVILAIYYTFADIVLLGQCLYYRSKKQKQQQKQQQRFPGTDSDATAGTITTEHNPLHNDQRHHLISDEAVHLSPATPLLLSLDRPKHRNHEPEGFGSPTSSISTTSSTSTDTTASSSAWRLWSAILFNTTAIVMVCLAGIVGWLLTSPQTPDDDTNPTPITFDTLGQTFGYLCAVLYLASRVPQIYLNYTRKTVEGLSLLFFLFACLGNLTYVISIIAYVPRGASSDGRRGNWTPEMRKEYWLYIAVNASWLLGSVGTLFLDMVIFVQFFWYRDAGLDYDYEYDYERISDDEDEAP